MLAGACSEQSQELTRDDHNKTNPSNRAEEWFGGRPDDRILDRIEARLILPKGAEPLHSYSRAYAWVHAGKQVEGRFLLGDDRRYWTRASELPMILDGGCAFVSVLFDVRRGEVESVQCNGEA